jgi:hypothetical protein
LLAAQLTDRISWGNIAKSLIFMPMAISFVGAAVIFKLIYDARPADQAQIGVLNAVWLQFDGGAGTFLILQAPAGLIICSAFAGLLAYGIATCRSGRWFRARQGDEPGGGSWWTCRCARGGDRRRLAAVAVAEPVFRSDLRLSLWRAADNG